MYIITVIFHNDLVKRQKVTVGVVYTSVLFPKWKE